MLLLAAVSALWVMGCNGDARNFSDGCEDVSVQGYNHVERCCYSDACYYLADGEKLDCNGTDCTEVVENLEEYRLTDGENFGCSDVSTQGCAAVQLCCQDGKCHYTADGVTFSCKDDECSDAASAMEEFCLGDGESYTCVDFDTQGCGEVEVCCSPDHCHYWADGERIRCDGLDCYGAHDVLEDYCLENGGKPECSKLYLQGCLDVERCCKNGSCHYDADGKILACDGSDCSGTAPLLMAYCSGEEGEYECVDAPAEGCEIGKVCCDSDDCYHYADGQIFLCDDRCCAVAAGIMADYCSVDGHLYECWDTTQIMGCERTDFCCTGVDCFYRADGEIFYCGGPICRDAHKELQNFCQEHNEADFFGDACNEDADCAEDLMCLDGEFADNAFVTSGLTVKNGYCTVALCESYTTTDGHSDWLCNENLGGLCFSLYPLMTYPMTGEAYAMSGFCFRPCETDADCRAEDDNFCLDPAIWKDGGLLDASVYDHYYGGVKVCVPRDLSDLMEDNLRELGEH